MKAEGGGGDEGVAATEKGGTPEKAVDEAIRRGEGSTMPAGPRGKKDEL